MPKLKYPKELRFFEAPKIKEDINLKNVPDMSFHRIIAQHPNEPVLYCGDQLEDAQRELNHKGFEVKPVDVRKLGETYQDRYFLSGILGSHGAIHFSIERKAKLVDILPVRKAFDPFFDFLKETFPNLSEKKVRDFLEKGNINFLYFGVREIPVEHQGKGIGTRFLEELEKFARNKKVDLMCGSTMNPAAMTTYKRKNWVELGRDRQGFVIFVKWVGDKK